MLFGVVGGVGDDGVCECGLSVYGGFNVSGGSVHGDVKVVKGVVFSASAVNCSLWCRPLKSLRISWMLVWVESNTRKTSSTYRQ